MKILYFAPISYGDIKQRPQHIAEELAKEHEVWYVDSTITGMRCLKWMEQAVRLINMMLIILYMLFV